MISAIVCLFILIGVLFFLDHYQDKQLTKMSDILNNQVGINRGLLKQISTLNKIVEDLDKRVNSISSIQGKQYLQDLTKTARENAGIDSQIIP